MIITEMKWRECLDFQFGHRLGRVVCAKDDWAYVVPILCLHQKTGFAGSHSPPEGGVDAG